MKRKITRRDFVGTSLAASLTLGSLLQKSMAESTTPDQGSRSKLGSPAPGASPRVIYVSDPSSIALGYLPDPVAEADLRHWVDELADAQVDTFVQEAYTQGWTTYWRTDKFEYDARPQHRRFLPLLVFIFHQQRIPPLSQA